MTDTIDPELRSELARMRAAGIPPVTRGNLAEMRMLTTFGAPSDTALSRGGAVQVSRATIPGGPPVLVLRPAGRSGPLPAVLFLHGGGMMLGDERSDCAAVAEWVEQAGLVAVSVGYRLAPEHPYPAAIDDCATALDWVAGRSAELGTDGRVVLAGFSAGAGLAAGTALRVRDLGGPAVAGQLLICPMLDDRNVAAAGESPPADRTWNRLSNRTGWTALLGARRGGPDVSPYAAPARATDLSGLPPAFVEVGAADIFLAEDVDYARRILAAGGSAELHVWAGAYHGFDGRVPGARVSLAARASRVDWLRRVLRG